MFDLSRESLDRSYFQFLVFQEIQPWKFAFAIQIGKKNPLHITESLYLGAGEIKIRNFISQCHFKWLLLYVLFIYINNMIAYLAFATSIRHAMIWKEFVSKFLRPKLYWRLKRKISIILGIFFIYHIFMSFNSYVTCVSNLIPFR